MGDVTAVHRDDIKIVVIRVLKENVCRRVPVEALLEQLGYYHSRVGPQAVNGR